MEGKEPMLVWLPFVGGIRRSQTKVLASSAAKCRECEAEAAFVKYDNVLELFSLPLWRWPGRNPALVCENCRNWLWTSHFEPLPTAPETPPGPQEQRRPRDEAPAHCWSCARLLEPIYKFCPDCGSRQDFW